MSALKRLKRLINEKGYSYLFKKVLTKIFNIFFEKHKLVLQERDLSQKVNIEPPRLSSTIRVVSKDNLDFYESLKRTMLISGDYENGCIRDRLAKGDLCYIAEENNETMAHIWVSVEDQYIPEVDMIMHIKDGEGYLYNGYVLPEYRGNRLWPAIGSNILSDFQERGFAKMSTTAYTWNIPSIKASMRIGLIEKKYLILYKFLSFFRYHVEKEFSTTQ